MWFGLDLNDVCYNENSDETNPSPSRMLHAYLKKKQLRWIFGIKTNIKQLKWVPECISVYVPKKSIALRMTMFSLEWSYRRNENVYNKERERKIKNKTKTARQKGDIRIHIKQKK